MKKKTVRFVVASVLSCCAALSAAPAGPAKAVPALQDSSQAITAGTGRDSAAAKAVPAKDSSHAGRKKEFRDTVRYEADKIDYDAENRILQLTGRAKVAYQNVTLLADSIVYAMNDNLFTATGRPELIEDKDTTVGDFMAYNIQTKRGRVRYATTHVDEAYFYGQRIIKSPENDLYVDKGEYTTCALIDTPHYYFYGECIRLIPNNKIISRPAVLNIGDAPVAALPYFIFPVERNRKSGILTPVWGGNPSGGGFIDNIGYYWAPGDYADFEAHTRIKEFSEFVVEVSSRYALKYLLNGSFSARDALTTGMLKSTNQWALDYSHSQNLTPDGLTQLTGSGHLVSTQYFYSKFSQDSSELRQQNLTANVALSRQFQDLKASGSVVWNRTQDLSKGRITDDLPSVNFSLYDRPLIPPAGADDNLSTGTDTAEARWFNTIYWGYSGRGIVRRDSWENSANRGFIRPGAYNEIHLNAPQKLFKYVTLTPNASANLATFYGYIDTTVRGYDTTHTTVTYSTHKLSDTVRYADYTTTGIGTEYRDSLGYPDTIYTITRKSPPIINPRRDTINNSFSNIYGWRMGASLSTNLYGIFPVHVLNFAGLRHTMTPSVSYTFVPRHDLDKMFYDIGISPEGAHDRQQIINFSLANQFDGKILRQSADSATGKPTEVKFPILSARLGASYDFESKGRKWSDLSMNASTGYRFLGVNYGSTYWLYDESGRVAMPILKQYNYNLSTGSFSASGKLWDGDRLLLDSLRPADPVRDRNAGPQAWQFSVTPAYTYSASRVRPSAPFVPSKSYSLSSSASLGFTRNWKISWSGIYNFTLDQMVQNSVNISCDLECWDLRFQWRPEKLNPGYYFIINVKKIPELKWEQKSEY